MTFRIPSLVQRNNTDMIATYKVCIPFDIIKDKREDAVKLFKQLTAFVAVQGQDNFAIAVC